MTRPAGHLALRDVPTPTSEQLKRKFRASARALLENRPLRGWSTPATDARSALSKSELDALRAVHLTTEPWSESATDDPLERSITDFLALVETGLTVAETAKRLGVDPSRVRQRLRERSLFGVDYEGAWRLPRFQFERNLVLPGFAEVLQAMPADVPALDLTEWFLSSNPDLEVEKMEQPLSPRAWLLQGRPAERVAHLARHL
jgi:hypothetical protein